MIRTFAKLNLNANRNRAWTVSMLLAIGVVAALAGVVEGQCMYEVEVIAAPPCQFGQSVLIASGLNNLGEAVGRFSACPGCTPNCWDSAFYWSKATGTVPLPKPDGVTIMRAFDINDMQQIVGEMWFTGIGWRGFMYDMLADEFHFLEPKFGVGMAVVNAINNEGIAVGARSITKGGSNPHNAVIWDTNTGNVTDLGVIWLMNSSARDVNSSMAVAGVTGPSLPPGQQAFLAYDKKTIIGMMPNGTSTDARGMNDNNLVVGGGFVQLPEGGTSPRGFVWDGQKFELIDPLTGFTSSSANAINSHGQVAAASSNLGGPTRAMLWQHGISVDLNELTSGPTLTSTPDINNSGQILARASTRAALLSPMDVPVGDLNFDCRVDGHDLVILLKSWGPVPLGTRGARGSNTNPNADLNGDGVVDGADLLILLANWTF